MRIKCDKCGAHYNISEEKIKGKAAGVKVKCKKCGNLISISPGQTDEASYHSSSSGEYFLILSGQREGPFTAEEVRGMLKRGTVDGNTFYWKKGLASWSTLKEAVEFAELFGKKEDELTKTDFLPISEIRASQRASAFQTESRAQEIVQEDEKTVVMQMPWKEEEEESKERRVWERSETSVLFSLDDVKLNKKEDAGGRDFRKEDAVIDLSSISQPEEPKDQKKVLPRPRCDDARDTIISLEGVDLTQATQVLKLKKKKRKYIAAAALLGLVVSAIAVFFLILSPEPVPVTNMGEHPKEEAKIEKIERAEIFAEKKATTEEPVVVKPKPQNGSSEEAKKEQIVAVKQGEASKGAQKKLKVAKETGSQPKVKDTTIELAKKEKKIEAGKEIVPLDANKLLQDLNIKGNSQKEGVQQERLPSRLSITQIHSVMRKSVGKVSSCVHSAGIEITKAIKIGTLITILPSGGVESAKVTSGNAGAAEGCIISVLKSMTFPQFSGDKMSVPYPFMVTP